ncbi:AraC family transcriptional regulator [Solimonas sp. K1W22B-7]|uniref:AraC family transcriptional regulator n=1 Tax=Solimonas sp. K1W22B-7 TaxID=2303331 RepID=UPI000E336E04|nr:AraC family transcriptional regulator [Solimonas sp. K1W22B-7]AXQ28559.1 AraC family transcriptional regulator [Solimonas sp. K1W22B-7]
MAGACATDSPGPEAGAADEAHALVRVDALRKFGEVVTGLGGNPAALLSKANIDPGVLDNRHALIPYRTLVQLLERAADELDCPDFGMRLAAAQDGLKVLGPLEFAMRNSRTLREAFHYCTQHLQVYSTASQMHAQPGPADSELFFHFEILLPKLSGHCQAIERALLLAQHVALHVTGGQTRAREVWFMHEPLSPPSGYLDYFGSPVRFGQAMDGLLFAEPDLDTPVPDADPQLYELASDFISSRFPAKDSLLSARMRGIVERLLLDGGCSYDGVASMLGMHPRTLQRRLKAEGESFEAIKDGVRRDIALRYLRQSSVPLIQVARMLGYAETSALSRSCYRWFSASPRQLRHGAANVEDRARAQSA